MCAWVGIDRLFTIYDRFGGVMIATKYTQSVQKTISSGGKITLYAGVALEIASVALLIVGIFVNLYVLFGFIGVLAIGALLCQIYYSLTIEYNYNFTDDALIITKKDVRLRRTTLLTVKFDSVLKYEIFADCVNKEDKNYMAYNDDPLNKALTFKMADGAEVRMLFSPDDYLNALICEKLKIEEI